MIRPTLQCTLLPYLATFYVNFAHHWTSYTICKRLTGVRRVCYAVPDAVACVRWICVACVRWSFV